jgi:MerR family redox-sensitive transcriptional activator SoxR
MKDMTIGEVARRAGLQTSAIRYYESLGLLSPPKRVNGRRRYDASVLRRLAVIQLARQAGFRIADLRALLLDFPADAPPSVRWQKVAHQKIAEIDALIERSLSVKAWLLEAMSCQCEAIEDCAAVMPEPSNSRLPVSLACNES